MNKVALPVEPAYRRLHAHGEGHGLGRSALDSLIFEYVHQLRDMLEAWLEPREYTEPELHIAAGLPGPPSLTQVYLAKKSAPYHWIENPKIREEKQKALLASHNLGKFDILDLFNV
jgi:hypothetical protein